MTFSIGQRVKCNYPYEFPASASGLDQSDHINAQDHVTPARIAMAKGSTISVEGEIGTIVNIDGALHVVQFSCYSRLVFGADWLISLAPLEALADQV